MIAGMPWVPPRRPASPELASDIGHKDWNSDNEEIDEFGRKKRGAKKRKLDGSSSVAKPPVGGATAAAREDQHHDGEPAKELRAGDSGNTCHSKSRQNILSERHRAALARLHGRSKTGPQLEDATPSPPREPAQGQGSSSWRSDVSGQGVTAIAGAGGGSVEMPPAVRFPSQNNNLVAAGPQANAWAGTRPWRASGPPMSAPGTGFRGPGAAFAPSAAAGQTPPVAAPMVNGMCIGSGMGMGWMGMCGKGNAGMPQGPGPAEAAMARKGAMMGVGCGCKGKGAGGMNWGAGGSTPGSNSPWNLWMNLGMGMGQGSNCGAPSDTVDWKGWG